ncbi:MAG: hypothetical protein IKI21_11395 [Oscillospiraceae bacterium]|nr:hypothetical protein [Oscillospiraceae bacterium]
MNKPKGMQEYDGYTIPDPRPVSEEERQKLMKKVEENRKKILEANREARPAQK